MGQWEYCKREIPGVRSLAFQALIILRRFLVLVSKTPDFLSFFHTFLLPTFLLAFGTVVSGASTSSSTSSSPHYPWVHPAKAHIHVQMQVLHHPILTSYVEALSFSLADFFFSFFFSPPVSSRCHPLGHSSGGEI